MAFYLEEAGLRTHRSRASIAGDRIDTGRWRLAQPVRDTLFGGMDYAIFAIKL